MRRISGLDLNGWQDLAARDWEPEDPDERLPNPTIVDGGIGGVAVRQTSEEWIGGPQAALAPHGRGNGWGLLGAGDRRVAIAEVFDGIVAGRSQVNSEAYAAATKALSRGAQDVILTVPDHQAFDEAAQGRILSLLRRDRRAYRLLWRPVALFLDALERREISRDADGARFRFLIHSAAGLEVQTLRLRKDSEHRGHVAPERDGYGHLTIPRLGLQELKERAHRVVLEANPLLADGRCEQSTLDLELLFGRAEPGDTRILRHNNGNWFEVVAPDIAPSMLLTQVDLERVSEMDAGGGPITASFLITPLAERLAAPLAAVLEEPFGRLRRLDWQATARGALYAGRLIERGLPHYFDRLTPIRLAVLRNDRPDFEDLVGSDATLPANREYVSPPYRDLKWLRGKTEVDFYVLKGDTEVRHWQANLESAPPRDIPVELRLRQTPGQSWAKLSLTSPEWEPLQRNPISLDWATLTPIGSSPAEVLEQLRTPPPTIPERIVELPSDEFWTGSIRIEGILNAIQKMRSAGGISPGRLSALLRRSMRSPETGARLWPIGTDGTLPTTLSSFQVADFLSVLDDLDASIQRSLSRGIATDKDLLRCLTWTFTLCPEATQRVLVEALEADLQGTSYPLVRGHSRTVLTQGAARTVTGIAYLRRVLAVLASRRVNNDTLSAFAMILSRRNEAPQALTGALVDKILELVSQELINLASQLSFRSKFKNALLALAGLFRYREVDPYALLAGRDPLAQTLRTHLDEIDTLLHRNKQSVRLFKETSQLIDRLQELLDGRGDPNILLLIEDFAADDEQGEDREALV
ncbi:hypothetical protein ACETIH_03100 [Microvirga arabica]|uniref:Uncharacterized protein n=1 Tax=Microvirga arabica TaxID=1128671 RepID=A0ABV6Y382_9HYPH